MRFWTRQIFRYLKAKSRWILYVLQYHSASVLPVSDIWRYLLCYEARDALLWSLCCMFIQRLSSLPYNAHWTRVFQPEPKNWSSFLLELPWLYTGISQKQIYIWSDEILVHCCHESQLLFIRIVIYIQKLITHCHFQHVSQKLSCRADIFTALYCYDSSHAPLTIFNTKLSLN